MWSSAAERLARQGNKVRVSVRHSPTPIPQIERLRSVGCKIFYRPPILRPFLQRQVRRIIPGPPYHEEHMRFMAKSPDLVVISQGCNVDGLAWMEAALAGNHKYAVVAQSANEQWWPADHEAQRFQRCYEQAQAAFFVSEANLALTRMQFVTPLAKGRVARNPFNVSYQANPPWPEHFEDTLRLGCVARLDVVQKGHDLLFQVLERPLWRKRKVAVTLAGSGNHAHTLCALAARYNLRNVEFAGQVNDIESLWAQHHALILPSRFEGMPLALVEAMLCGRPAIVTNVGGNCELVRDNMNGFVAEAATVDLLDKAMERAWHDRNRLREMGETAARDVRQWVGPDPTADFVQELESLVDGHG